MAKDILKLSVAERTATGKGPNRRLRMQSIVPGVYYDQHGANILVQVPELRLRKVYEKVGGSQVFHLEIERNGKSETLPALIWRLKHDPVRPILTHVDFFGVDLDKDIKVNVHVTTSGTAKGTKLGGKLEIFRDHIEVICKPLDIPELIRLDITELDVNSNIFVEDIQLPEGVKAVYEENFAVLGIVPVDDEEDEGEAAAAE